MTRRTMLAIAILGILLACSAVCAQDATEGQDAADKVTLKYQPAEETTTLQQLHANVDSISMEGNPLGISGTISSKVKHLAKPMDAEKQTFNLTLQLDEISQVFQGQEVAGGTQASMCVDVSPTGLITAEEHANAKMFTTAGIPIELLALLCHVVRFPDEAVAAGDEWEITDDVQLSEDDEPIPMTAQTKLFKIDDDGNAWLLSQVSAELPTFSAPNPMGYGAPVQVNNGRLKITDMWRVFNTGSSVVTRAEGKVKFSGQVDMQGYPMSGEMAASFVLDAVPDQLDEKTTDEKPADGGANAGGGQATAQ